MTYPNRLPPGARAPKRIDYLLSRPGAALPLKPLSSGLLGGDKVPLGDDGTQDYVSDHLGVWVRYAL